MIGSRMGLWTGHDKSTGTETGIEIDIEITMNMRISMRTSEQKYPGYPTVRRLAAVHPPLGTATNYHDPKTLTPTDSLKSTGCTCPSSF